MTKTDHKLCLLFLGSLPNSGYKQVIFFYCSESTTFQNNRSHFLPFAWHVKFFTSLTLANKCLNHNMIERYHNTFARGPFFNVIFVIVMILDFVLWYPNLGHLCNALNSFLYNIQSLEQAWIFWYAISIVPFYIGCFGNRCNIFHSFTSFALVSDIVYTRQIIISNFLNLIFFAHFLHQLSFKSL